MRREVELNSETTTLEQLVSSTFLCYLTDELKALVVNSFEPIAFQFGTCLVREGEENNGLYFIVSGRARVLKRSEDGTELPLNTLCAGDLFGEVSLLTGGGCSATVRASTEGEVLKLDSRVLGALMKQYPEIRTALELQATRRELGNFFQEFGAFSELPPKALETLIVELESVSVAPGEIIVTEGDPGGPMYFIREGRFKVYRGQEENKEYLSFLRKGDYFGELSLMKNANRAASVVADTKSELLKLSPETFHQLVEKYPEFRAELEERIAQYDYERVAKVPLDFTQELMPRDPSANELVSEDQVEVEATKAESRDAGADHPYQNNYGHFVKADERIKKFPFLRQVDEMDCGVAALGMVCRHFGKRVSLAKIRDLAHTATDGTSIRGLCSAASQLGLAARAVKASKKNLDKMPLPAIVHWDGNHWVVLYDVQGKKVSIADPAIGLRKIDRKEFEERWSGYAALFDYTEEFSFAPETPPTIAWILPFFKPYLGLIAKAGLLALVVSALQMVLPIFTQIIVDKILVEQDKGLLNIIMLSMFGVLFFVTGALIIQRFLLSFAAVRIDAKTLDFLTRKLLALPMRYFNSRRTGDIQRRLDGAQGIREFVVHGIISGLTGAIQLTVTLILMGIYSPILTAVFLLTTPLYLGMMVLSSKWLRPLFDRIEEGYARYHSYQIDAIKGIETVKSLGAEMRFRGAMIEQFHMIASRMFKADLTVMCYDGLLQVVSFLSMTIFLWVGAYEVMNGNLSIGGLMAFNALVAMANAPIMMVLGMWDDYQRVAVLMNRLNDIFEAEPEQGDDHSELLPVRQMEGGVKIQGLTFRYGNEDSPAILDDISLEVPAGKTIAIVGRSGSGKTTFAKCLAGLLEPSAGTIFYDNVDMQMLNHRQLRQQIGFVLQDNYIFDDTIKNNIAFGADEPDNEQVLWAAQAANAHEFIARLPLGYETRIGETGVSLSGGQKQRVAIARAIYHRPSLLIMDEATSALDTESERALKDNLAGLLAERTSFVIAHRLSTIRDADLIIVLEQGKLVEKGTHEELLALRGLYFYLCSQQLGM